MNETNPVSPSEVGVVNEVNDADTSTMAAANWEEMECSNNIQQEGREKRRHVCDENSSEEEWNTIHPRSRKMIRRSNSEVVEKIQVYVMCSSGLPKQFALAKLLRDNKVTGISDVKYVHQHKIVITFEEESSADLLIQSKILADLGWRCQRSSEVGLSYGIIRNIDIEMTEEEIMKNVSSHIEIVSVRRLNKRKYNENDTASGWEKCEAIRLAFRGTSVPTHILIYDMRVKVASYVFPVTQCSRCWKFGHTRLLCPSKKVVCPKCTKNHENCKVTNFRCVNCTGPHMALQKICPMFKKERRVRELMSEFNCTFRKALEVYVPPSPVPDRSFSPGPPLPEVRRPLAPSILCEPERVHQEGGEPAQRTKLMSDLFTNTEDTPFKLVTNKRAKAHRKSQLRPPTPAPSPSTAPMETDKDIDSEVADSEPRDVTSNPPPSSQRRSVKDMSFVRLLAKMYTIIIGRDSVEAKIQQVVSICGEWILVNVVSGFSAGSLLSMFTNYG